jgi:hypothetical protein
LPVVYFTPGVLVYIDFVRKSWSTDNKTSIRNLYIDDCMGDPCGDETDFPGGDNDPILPNV